MRRVFVAVFAMLVALPLAAAAPAPSVLGTPTLLIYPFAVNGGDINKEAGSRLAVAIASQIADLGGVAVKPAPPGVERQAYLDAARRESVDYYIAGYVTPLGDGVSVVEQLVSTQTGIVVFSNTAQIRSYADAAGQGDVLREALLRHQTRNLGAYAAPPPPPQSPSPAPAASGAAQANLGRLFGRRQKREPASAASPRATPIAVASPGAATPAAATPAASPAPPTPATVVAAPLAPPAAGYGMLEIGGSADLDRRAFTGAAIRNVLLANHRRVAPAAAVNPDACRAANVGTLLGGTLATRKRTILGEPQTSATLDLVAYDCSGSVVYRRSLTSDARGDWKAAVDRVVQRAVASFLHDAATQRG